MVKRILALLLISLAYSRTSTQPVAEENKPAKYRVVVHKSNGEKIISKTQ